MMEGPNQPENLQELKSRIIERYKTEGDSEELENAVEEWMGKRFQEADQTGTMQARLEAEIELCELRLEIGKNKEEIIEELEDALDSARGEGLEELAQTIRKKIVSI